MMRISFVALVIFVTVECAPQRRPPADQDVISRGPIFVKGLLSQIHELRNNVHENRQRLVGSVLEPVGRIGRPHHDHRKGGRPHGMDEDAKLNQRTQIPIDENDQSTHEKNRKENPKKTEKEDVPSKVLPPPPPPGGLPPPPSSGSTHSTEDWSHVVAPSNDNGQTDELKRKIIGAPCLGGITSSGDCRPSFD